MTERAAPPPWSDIMAAVRMLAPREQAALALLGAERLVLAAADESLPDLIAAGWAHLDDGDHLDALGVALADLDERDDLDDNEVAVVSYALTAAVGADSGMSEEAATWAVMRVVDAAFESVPPPPASELASLQEDASHPVVQRELAWLRSATFSLRQRGATAQTVASLRMG